MLTSSGFRVEVVPTPPRGTFHGFFSSILLYELSVDAAPIFERPDHSQVCALDGPEDTILTNDKISALIGDKCDGVS